MSKNLSYAHVLNNNLYDKFEWFGGDLCPLILMLVVKLICCHLDSHIYNLLY